MILLWRLKNIWSKSSSQAVSVKQLMSSVTHFIKFDIVMTLTLTFGDLYGMFIRKLYITLSYVHNILKVLEELDKICYSYGIVTIWNKEKNQQKSK